MRSLSLRGLVTRIFSPGSREGWIVFLLVITSLAIRLGYLQEIKNFPLFSNLKLDEEFHDQWAQSIASGNVVGDEVYFRAPFYAYFLGAIFRISGHNLFLARIIQHILGSFGVLLVFFVSRKLFGKSAAWIASVLYALYPFVIYIEDQLLLESIVNVVLLVLIFIIYRGDDKLALPRWFFIGVLVGILSLIRPTFLTLLVLLIGYVFFRYRRPVGAKKIILVSSVVISGTAIMIAPVTIRNYIVGNDAVLIASQGGVNFYMGNNPDASGYLSAMPGTAGVRWEYGDFVEPVRKALGGEPKPSELSEYWYGQGLRFFREHPVNFLALFVKKNYMFWSRFEIPNNQNFYSFEDHSEILRDIPIGFWLVGPLGLLGMVFAWKLRRGRFLVVYVLVYSVVVALFFVCDRFRMPVLPFLCIFSGVSVDSVIILLKRRRFHKIGLYLPLFIVFVWLTNSNLTNFEPGNRKTELFYLANASLESGQYHDAIAKYRECSSMPGIVQDVSLNWGVALWNDGRTEEALRKFHEELDNFPSSYNSLTNIARLYLILGQNDSALTYAARAIAVKSYAPTAYIDMGLAYSNSGKLAAAESVLVLGKTRCGEDAYLYGTSVLAGVHQVEGNTGIAEAEYRGVLQKLKPNAQPSYLPEFQFSRDYTIEGNLQDFKARIYFSLGHLFLGENNIDSALAYFTLTKDEAPGFADAWFALGSTWLDLHRAADACAAFGKGLERQPGNRDAWFQYGVALRETGNFREARSAFTTALSIDSAFQEAREALRSLPAK